MVFGARLAVVAVFVPRTTACDEIMSTLPGEAAIDGTRLPIIASRRGDAALGLRSIDAKSSYAGDVLTRPLDGAIRRIAAAARDGARDAGSLNAATLQTGIPRRTMRVDDATASRLQPDHTNPIEATRRGAEGGGCPTISSTHAAVGDTVMRALTSRPTQVNSTRLAVVTVGRGGAAERQTDTPARASDARRQLAGPHGRTVGSRATALADEGMLAVAGDATVLSAAAIVLAVRIQRAAAGLERGEGALPKDTRGKLARTVSGAVGVYRTTASDLNGSAFPTITEGDFTAGGPWAVFVDLTTPWAGGAEASGSSTDVARARVAIDANAADTATTIWAAPDGTAGDTSVRAGNTNDKARCTTAEQLLYDNVVLDARDGLKARLRTGRFTRGGVARAPRPRSKHTEAEAVRAREEGYGHGARLRCRESIETVGKRAVAA